METLGAEHKENKEEHWQGTGELAEDKEEHDDEMMHDARWWWWWWWWWWWRQRTWSKHSWRRRFQARSQQVFYFLSSLPYPLLATSKKKAPRPLWWERTSQGKIFIDFQCFHVACIACIAPRQVYPRWSHARHSLWGMALFYVYRAMDNSYVHYKSSMGIDPQGELSVQDDCSMGFL